MYADLNPLSRLPRHRLRRVHSAADYIGHIWPASHKWLLLIVCYCSYVVDTGVNIEHESANRFSDDVFEWPKLQLRNRTERTGTS